MPDQFQKQFDLEKRIDNYMSDDPASYTKLKLNEINELTQFEWPQLLTKITLGEYQVKIMAPALMTFYVLADSSQKNSAKFFNILTFAIPVAAIALSIIFSWWFMLLILLVPVMSGASKSAYSEAILSSALVSEKCFSFLFSRGVICLSGDEGVVYHSVE